MPKLPTRLVAVVLSALVVAPLAAQSRRPARVERDRARDLAQLVETEYGAAADAFAVEDVALLGAAEARAQEAWVARVPLGAFEADLFLRPLPLRADDALLRVWTGEGYEERELPPSSTYRGHVVGAPGSIVVASLTDDGLRADVVSGEHAGWSVRPLRELEPAATRNEHVVFRDARPSLPGCGVTEMHVVPSAAGAADGEAGGLYDEARPGEDCMSRAQIAFDADFEYFVDQGGTVQAVVDRIEAHMNEVDFFYARDVRITYRITGYVVRTAPFYTPTSGGNLLDQFRAEWNTNQAGVIPYDIGHLMTAKPGNLIEYGGLAWVGVVCTDLAYGWSLDSAGIIGHEVGHNWNAPHCLDPTPCNNMCGACLNIGPVTKGVIEAHRDSRACLRRVDAYATPLPPYFYPEVATVPKEDFDTNGAVLVDVLANDEDGNCDEIQLVGFDPLSTRGGTISRSVGTGARGQDEVRYLLPAGRFVGTDTFDVTVGDFAGQTTTGTVTIEVRPYTRTGWWRLDEAGGSNAVDENGAFPGTYQGNPTRGEAGATSETGSSVYFDGVGDRVRLDDLDLNTDRVTIAAWVKRDGDQPPFSGIVFNNSGTTHAGLAFGEANELRYVWNGDPLTRQWDSGLVVPDGIWTFVALVVRRDRATVYRGLGGALASATHLRKHDPEAFDDRTFIARNAGGGGYVTGHVDDVRIYPWAMEPEEIEGLLLGGQAEVPFPADGGSLGLASTALSWTSGLAADSHDVYFGTDYDAVLAATTGSPEFQGNQPGASFVPAGTTGGTRYFWRVDEHYGTDVVKGRVWEYELATLAHWTLDDLAGTTAVEESGNFDGTYVNTPTLGQPGVIGTAVDFNGTNERVNVPALNLNTNTLTISAWVRRQGALASFAGIVFSRASSTTAGLNVGDANELRYHWNGGNWPWDSGLVLPDDTWVFVALVVEPHQATIYLGDGGVLSSAVNTASHDIEEFDGQLRIGQDAAGGRYFGGLIDDVRIWNAALTPAEIGLLYP